MHPRTFVRGKIILVGEEKAGKTSWVRRILNDTYNEDYNYTQGVETFRRDDGLYLWDTAGKESVKGLGDGYYIGAEIAVIFIQVDTSGRLRLNKPLEYLRDVNRVLTDESKINPGKVVWVVSKMDRATKGTQRLIEEFRSRGNKKIFQISAKTGQGCQELYDFLLRNSKVYIPIKLEYPSCKYILGDDGYVKPLFV